MTAGVLATILMTAFLELTSPRRRRLEAELDVSALPEIDALLRELAGRMQWDLASVEQLRAAGEEALTCLLQVRGDRVADKSPRMILVARPGRETVEMEFLAVFRLLRHYASSVRHRKYHGIDVVAVKVAGSRREKPGA